MLSEQRLVRRPRSALSSRALLGSLSAGMALLSLAFLAFLGGAFLILNKAWPYFWLNGAYSAAVAAIERETGFDSPYQSNLWTPARRPDRGVTIHAPDKAHDGLTLYTSGHDQKVFLIGMDGRLVHSWHLPFSRIWQPGSGIRDPRPDDLIYARQARLMPNGDLLAMYEAMGETPWGYAMVKMNKRSEPIWTHMGPVHHDLDIARDGRIYTLTSHIRWREIEEAQNLEPPRLDDFVLVLSPDGKPIREVSILHAIARSPFARLLITVPPNPLGDFLHTNDIELIEEGEAAILPFAAPGQVLLSMRDISTIAILDLDSEQIVWAQRGSWLRQHDIDILPGGNLMLFDNLGHFGPGGRSRVIEFDPVTMQAVWTYAGDDRHPFDSEFRSEQQRLPNGNTVINESDGGRIFEVTPQKEIVWEFVNPVRGGASDEFIPIVSGGMRIGWDGLDPGFVSR